jgi:hypothetical protein
MIVSSRPVEARAARVAAIAAAAGVLALAGLLWAAAVAPPEATAFDHSWVHQGCQAGIVPKTDPRFFDDAPGAGTNNESAWISMLANDLMPESCTWRTTLSVNATHLQVRAAVNDGSILTVQAFGSGSCTTQRASVVYSGTVANNVFNQRQSALTSGAVQSICVRIGDGGAANRRVSALIDRVTLLNGSTVVWQESFSRPG